MGLESYHNRHPDNSIVGFRYNRDSTKKVVSPLIKALDDKEAEVRRNAALALKEIGTPEAMKAVAEYERRQ